MLSYGQNLITNLQILRQQVEKEELKRCLVGRVRDVRFGLSLLVAF